MIPSFLTWSEAVCHTFKSGDSPSLTYQRHRYLGRLPYPFPPFCEPDEKELAKKEDILVYPGMIMVKVTLKSQEQHRACSPGSDTLSQPLHHQTTPWGNDSCNATRSKYNWKALKIRVNLENLRLGVKHSPVSSSIAASPPPLRLRLCKLEQEISMQGLTTKYYRWRSREGGSTIQQVFTGEDDGKNLGTGVTGFLTGPIPSKSVYSIFNQDEVRAKINYASNEPCLWIWLSNWLHHWASLYWALWGRALPEGDER